MISPGVDDEVCRTLPSQLGHGGTLLPVILSETLAMLGQMLQQGCRFPNLVMLFAKFADPLVDLLEANGIGVAHGASPISREAVAIDIDDVDVPRPQRVAFFQDARAF